MKNLDPSKSLISTKQFSIILRELRHKISYQEFLEKIRGPEIFKIIDSLKAATFYIRLFKTLDSDKFLKKPNIKLQIEMLKIITFVQLIESYENQNKDFTSLDVHLRHTFKSKERLSYKELSDEITNYQKKYSLSASVRNFLSNGIGIDNLWLISCLDIDADIRKIKGSLSLVLRLQQKKEIYRLQDEVKKLGLRSMLIGLLVIKTNKNLDQSKVDEINKQFIEQTEKYSDESFYEKLRSIGNFCYEIRSKFLHTGKSTNYFGYYIDQNKGKILNFGDFDFIRYFIRKVLYQAGFDIDVYNIPSYKKLLN